MTIYIDEGGGPGRSADGRPDHRRAFRVWGTITRETDRFYYVTRKGLASSETRRIDKNHMYTGGSYIRNLYTEAQMADEVWLRTYRSRINSAVGRADVATLRRVAAVLGMECP